MRKCNLVLLILTVVLFVFFTSCDESGGSDVSEATSLGDTLTFSGTVNRTYVPGDAAWTTSYTNASSLDYILTDENDDYAYIVDDNDGGNVEVSLSFGVPGSDHLISYGEFSSNSSAKFATIVIEVWSADSSDLPHPDEATYCTTDDDIMYGNFSSAPMKMYYYMYSTEETEINGTYSDSGETHVYENIKVFSGWNRMVKSTTDGVTFTYSGGEITDAHWTYIDNS